MREKPIIYAHRGMLREGENTSAAFTEAFKKKYGTELDVSATRTGDAIIEHGGNLRRTSNVDKVVPHLANKEIIVPRDLYLSQIKSLRLEGGQRILTVEEFAQLFPSTDENPRHTAYEIKDPAVAGQVLASALERGPLKHSSFIGFNPEYLAAIKDAEPEATVFKLLKPDEVVDFAEMDNYGFGLGIRIDDHSKRALTRWRKLGGEWLAYSPMPENEPEDFPRQVRAIYNKSPYGMILNDPDINFPLLKKRR